MRIRKSPTAVAALVAVLAVWLVQTMVRTDAAFTKTTGSPGNTFAAAASFCQPVTPVWLTGMEHGAVSVAGAGLFNTLDVSGGTVTADSAVKRNGNYSLKIADADAANVTQVVLSGYSLSTMTIRFGFRLGSLPGADVKEFAKFRWPAGNHGRFGFDSATQKFAMRFSTGTTQLSTTTVSANTWYLIDMKIDLSTNPNTLDWRVNGVNQPQVSEAQVATALNALYWGSTVAADTYTAYFDDIVITGSAADYPLGDGAVRGLSPNAMGTITNPNSYLKDNSGGTNVSSTSWQLVDETQLTSTADFIRQSTASASNYANVAFANIATTGCINGVRAEVAMHSSATGSNQARTSIFEGATETVVHDDDVSPGATLEYRGKIITPASGNWDATKLNSLEARIGAASNTGSQPYWDGLMIEYDQAP